MDLRWYLTLWSKHFADKNIVTDKAKSIYDINYSDLAKQGFRLLVFDVDDTLCSFLDVLPDKTIQLLQKLKKDGFEVGVFSNCSYERTKQLDQIFSKLDIYNVSRSDKPNPLGYKELLDHYKIDPELAVMVGDKIGTDLYGAFLAQFHKRILVKPYSQVYGGKTAGLFDKAIRNVEKRIYLK